MTQEWVVTCRIEKYGAAHCYGMTEFFRGTEEECRRISRAFAGGSCDIMRTSPWQIVIGPAEDWDYFTASEAEEAAL